jgi:hypothetical protein
MFTLTTDTAAMNGTSNISHVIIGPGKLEQLAQITPAIMEVTFGPGDDSCTAEYEKGYRDPEWYFTGPGGVVMGIGFRWGLTRLRGKNTHDHFMTREDIASVFLQFIQAEIEANLYLKGLN